jgi:hypothetical protein
MVALLLPIGAVPEPSTLLLLESGLVGRIGFRKKFKRELDIQLSNQRQGQKWPCLFC